MPRYKLTLEYEGTRYSGWQVQKDAHTVQGTLMYAITEELRNKNFDFQGAGRTDSGVHALHQVAHLDCTTVLDPYKFRLAVNDRLPHDIHIKQIEKAPGLFHARHDAVARSYLYQISRRRSAFGKRFVWWIKDELDLARMQEASRFFVGLKDFKNFAAKDGEADSTKVNLEELRIESRGDLILIRVVGSHFLWKMVRQITGILAEVGRGNMKPGDIAGLFRQTSPSLARLTAPPSGLFLERVYYKNDERLQTLEPFLAIR